MLYSPITFLLPHGGISSRQSRDGREVVDLRLRGVEGKTYDTEEMRGNVLLVSSGATRCLPSKAELAALEQLKKESAVKPVKFRAKLASLQASAKAGSDAAVR